LIIAAVLSLTLGIKTEEKSSKYKIQKLIVLFALNLQPSKTKSASGFVWLPMKYGVYSLVLEKQENSHT